MLSAQLLLAAALMLPWEGFYYGSSEGVDDHCALVSSRETVWIVHHTVLASHPERNAVGWALAPSSLTVLPPVAGSRSFRLRTEKLTLTQIEDPFLRKILQKLKSKHVFTRLSPQDGKPTQDTLSVSDGLWARLDIKEDKDRRCILGLLYPDLTENGSKLPASTSRQPKAGEGGMRLFMLGLTTRGCKAGSDGKDSTELTDNMGARLFADAKGNPIALNVIGYMYSEVYAAPGYTVAQLKKVFRAAQEFMEEQAE